jgi:hypothetical protein
VSVLVRAELAVTPGRAADAVELARKLARAAADEAGTVPPGVTPFEAEVQIIRASPAFGQRCGSATTGGGVTRRDLPSSPPHGSRPGRLQARRVFSSGSMTVR